MKLFGLKDENGKEYVIEADLRSCFHNIINVMPIEPTPKFKVGDWVIRKDEGVPMRIKHIDKYAFLCDDEISGHLLENAVGHCAFRLATASEIEKHLIKEAEKKGFKDGVRYKDPVNERIHKLRFDKLDYWEGDMLTDGWGGAIYQDGQWATIIPDKKPLPKTKKELMDLLGAYCNRHCKSVQEFLDDYAED